MAKAGAFPPQQIVGTCNASGTATLTVRSTAQFYSAVYVAAQVSGTAQPTWVIQDTPTLPRVFGSGGQTMLGPVILMPQSTVQLVCSGAAANATISGQVIGWQATNLDDLPDYLPTPSSVAISGGTINATISTGTVTISGPVSVINQTATTLAVNNDQTAIDSFTYNPPPGITRPAYTNIPVGTHGLIITFSKQPTSTDPITVNAVGNHTFTDYANVLTTSQYLEIPFVYIQDSSLILSLSGGSSRAPFTVTVSAAASSSSPTSITSLLPVNVSIQKLAWQSAQATGTINQLLTAGSSSTLIPAPPAGDNTYLHWCSIGTITGGTTVQLLGHTSGKIIAIANSNTTVNNAAFMFNKDFKGASLSDLTGVVEALDIKNAGSGTAGFIGSIDYAYGFYPYT